MKMDRFNKINAMRLIADLGCVWLGFSWGRTYGTKAFTAATVFTIVIVAALFLVGPGMPRRRP